MRKSRLFKIVLCLSLINLFFLIIFVQNTEPKEVKIIQLGDNIGREVLVSGEITKLTDKNNISFFTLEDNTAEIRVVAFENYNPLTKGSNISLRGKVEIYEKELEIIAQEIKLL